MEAQNSALTTTLARPFIVTDLDQPDLADLRYGGQLPRRRVKRLIGFDEWMEKWKKEFTKLNFKFRNRRHAFDVAYAFNLAEVSRRALVQKTTPDIADLYLGSEEIEIGLRIAVAATGAWVPTGDLLTDDEPALYLPRRMFSKDRAAVDSHQYIVFPVHGGRLHHWSLLIYDRFTHTANLRGFLERNEMDIQGLVIHHKPIPAQVSKVSCGWICLESARAFMHEQLEDWTKSVLYRDLPDTKRNLQRERAAVKNWEIWGAVSWRGTREIFYPVQRTLQAQQVQQSEQSAQVEQAQQAQPVQQVQASPAGQATQADAPTSAAATPATSAPALPPTLPPPSSPDDAQRRHLLSEAEDEHIAREHTMKLVDFISHVKDLTATPLSVREYYFFLLGSNGDYDKAVEAIERKYGS
ncbi:uncharacterized protein F4807DRAFT_471135 [Annulohypoxylon truncatum]|uniref:uncharacterized protein n=1 Tax=Annulohypoxylon truncatum TaxID=327061 RepID=UPI002007A41C|nr:uncharacterized protein F4807DRAFT_471135 [Annulohypoxylon truncatum]KAI1205279.1 hypothetical protein F4807DRAFT_471135 [Annulohypoxylon truncatum]